MYLSEEDFIILGSHPFSYEYKDALCFSDLKNDPLWGFKVKASECGSQCCTVHKLDGPSTYSLQSKQPVEQLIHSSSLDICGSEVTCDL